MGVEKSELKLAVLENLGCKSDDILESVERELHRAEGAIQALSLGSKAVRQLAQLVDDDLDKERYDIETATKVKEYLDRAGTLLDSMAQKATNQRMTGAGRVEMATQFVQFLKKEHDLEALKKKSFEIRDEDDDSPSSRPVGQRPAPSIKQQRLEEQANEDAAALMRGSVPKGKVPLARKGKKIPKAGKKAAGGGKNSG